MHPTNPLALRNEPWVLTLVISQCFKRFPGHHQILMSDKPLLNPYFWGGYARGGRLTSHDDKVSTKMHPQMFVELHKMGPSYKMVLFKAPYTWPEINGYNWNEIHPCYFWYLPHTPWNFDSSPPKWRNPLPQKERIIFHPSFYLAAHVDRVIGARDPDPTISLMKGWFIPITLSTGAAMGVFPRVFFGALRGDSTGTNPKRRKNVEQFLWIDIFLQPKKNVNKHRRSYMVMISIRASKLLKNRKFEFYLPWKSCKTSKQKILNLKQPLLG